MQYNKLGQSGINVSWVGVGCMSMSKDASKTDYQRLIHQAIEHGVNYFDTADLYNFGDNERLLGEAIKGRRDQLIIATKVGNQWKKDKSGWDWNVSADYINKAVNNSLSRLQTDYIDLYQIHGGTKEDNFDEVVDTLKNLKSSGKIKEYGISSIRPNVFLNFAEHANMVSNMMQFSMLDTRSIGYLSELKKHNISVLARGGFAQGLLLDKEAKDYLSHSIEKVKAIADMVADIALQHAVEKETVALSFLLHLHQITSAVVGVRTEKHLSQLIRATEQLETFDIRNLEISIPQIVYTDHLK